MLARGRLRRPRAHWHAAARWCRALLRTALGTCCEQPNKLNRMLTPNLLQEGPLILGRLAGAMSADDLKQCLEYIRQGRDGQFKTVRKASGESANQQPTNQQTNKSPCHAMRAGSGTPTLRTATRRRACCRRFCASGARRCGEHVLVAWGMGALRPGCANCLGCLAGLPYASSAASAIASALSH